MYAGLAYGAWPILILALPAAFLLVRIFIFQHDCGHGAFFRANWANALTGWACSVLTFAPYAHWRRQHAGHHGVWNDLDRRDRGADFYSSCTTLAEYAALTPAERFRFRLLRHPLVANLLIPPVLFLIIYRTSFDAPPNWQRERIGVHLTNLFLVTLYVALIFLFGIAHVAAVSLPVIILASIIGVWLFSIQHRFEGSVWMRHDQWTAREASLSGSSFLHLSPILRWLTGNIGFHHVHHLAPRIPNYRLRSCHASHPAFASVHPMGLRAALGAWRFVLWDEASARLVTLADARRAFSEQARA